MGRLVRRVWTLNGTSEGREAEDRTIRLGALGQGERLGYAVERLKLQSQQRQRQLGMSIVATVHRWDYVFGWILGWDLGTAYWRE